MFGGVVWMIEFEYSYMFVGKDCNRNYVILILM